MNIHKHLLIFTTIVGTPHSAVNFLSRLIYFISISYKFIFSGLNPGIVVALTCYWKLKNITEIENQLSPEEDRQLERTGTGPLAH